jgi:methyl-accepting chemotaxis protein
MSITRVVHTALRPGVSVLARLSYPKKLVLLAVLLALPACYAAWSYIQEQGAKIEFSADEREGVRYVQPVTELLAKLVAARDEAVAAAAEGRSAPAPALDSEAEDVAAVDRELGAKLKTTTAWEKLRTALDDLQAIPAGDAQAAFDAYGTATTAAQALIVQAGDKSNLILDPDLDSFYVMDAIITKLPAISDTLGRAGNRLVAHRGAVGVDQRIELAIDAGVVDSSAAAMSAGLATSFDNTADARLHRQLEAPLGRLEARIERAGAALQRAVRGRGVDAEITLAAAAAVAELNADLPAHLDRMLETRIDGFTAGAERSSSSCCSACSSPCTRSARSTCWSRARCASWARRPRR